MSTEFSDSQIFGSCGENLLKDWRSHYRNNDKPPWTDLDIVRGTEREMNICIKVSTLKPASHEQILHCASDYKSCSKSFLQDKSHSHGLGGEPKQVPYISHDLIWLLQSSIKPDETIVEKLEQIQKGLAEANFNSSEKVAYSADSMVRQLKTSSTIREQVSTNIKNLLLTIPGERVNQPTFGCELTSLIFEPQEDGLEDRIEAAIEEALAQWLPYVSINTIDIILTPDDNQVLVNLEFLVNVLQKIMS